MEREWNAEAYHRLSEPQFAWGRRVLDRLSLRGDETVIDAGCGTARLTVELAGLIPRGRILAVDLSENMLRRARSTASQASETKRAPIEFVCADVAALPFKEVAHGIFSTATFHWVGDHDALFRSLFSALKPGGWLIAQCGGGPNLRRLRQRTDEVMASAEFHEYFRGWNPSQNYQNAEDTAARLRRAGFGDVATWLHGEDVPFPDPATYKQFLATVTCHTHIARIPEPAQRDRFLDQLIALAQHEPNLHLDYWRLNIHARKPY